jgi:hypothetical protein
MYRERRGRLYFELEKVRKETVVTYLKLQPNNSLEKMMASMENLSQDSRFFNRMRDFPNMELQTLKSETKILYISI